MLYKIVDFLARQHTILINVLRAQLGASGIVKAQGPAGVNSLLVLVREAQKAVPVHECSVPQTNIAECDMLVYEIEKDMLDGTVMMRLLNGSQGPQLCA
jgi:transposase